MIYYRVARDSWYPRWWAVQVWRPWWPFWTEVGNGMLHSKQEALDLIKDLQTHYPKEPNNTQETEDEKR